MNIMYIEILHVPFFLHCVNIILDLTLMCLTSIHYSLFKTADLQSIFIFHASYL